MFTNEVPSLALLLLNKKYWIIHFLFVAIISIAGLIYLGYSTYDAAPPIGDIMYDHGKVIVTREEIQKGQEVFLQRGLMNYGTFWGDGSERGPDFTADALRFVTESMQRYYVGRSDSPQENEGVPARVTREQRTNGWNGSNIVVNDAQGYAWGEYLEHVQRMFSDPSYPSYIRLGYVLEHADLRVLAAFFYWGAWVTVTARPGESYSYTHNWPYYPQVGNYPTPETVLWSVISVFVLFLGTGFVLYAYGQMKVLYPEPLAAKGKFLTTGDLENGVVRSTQPATFKFFALAMALFGLQILAGIFCATDFVRPFGIYLGDLVPFSVARSYHTLFQIFWFFMCWVGYTIFFLPRLAPVPSGQRFLINFLFGLCVLVGIGALLGIFLGQTGIITGEAAYWIGSQGWEFMELGRLFQILLLFGFSLWIFIIWRAVKPWLTRKNLWSVPSWLFYGSGVMVFFLFFGLLVAPRSNFAIADYWRWMVVHMWVEVTFEVFTTVIVAYVMVQMNFITRLMAERAIFLAVMMFLFTATIGIAHNFYWIAKPTGIIALGSVFSTTQVLPLLLLTLDAWSMRRKGSMAAALNAGRRQKVVMTEVWQYILAVNFWNVFGAGVFGSLINLPIVNYFEHATYLTNNHAHGAMFGVKGNVAIGGMLFCLQHLFPNERWNPRLLRLVFWSLNIGVAMMMFLDLFPVGVYQLVAVLEHGFWFARSKEIVEGYIFQTLTYLRSLGGVVFVFGGVIPLLWFVLGGRPRGETPIKENSWPHHEESWASQEEYPEKAP